MQQKSRDTWFKAGKHDRDGSSFAAFTLTDLLACLPKPLRRRRSPSAFTLIELLVVIAIIGLLISLLAPSLGRARDAARGVQCANNIRSIALAVLQFVDDDPQNCFPIKNERRPDGTTLPRWHGLLRPYLGEGQKGIYDMQVYKSPFEENVISGAAYRFRMSYRLNRGLMAGNSPWGEPVSILKVIRPSATVMNASVSWHTPYAWQSEATFLSQVRRQNGKATYSFVDGHVETLALEETYDPARGIDQWQR